MRSGVMFRFRLIATRALRSTEWRRKMIIVSGKAKVKPGAVGAVRGGMEKAIPATREETGCLDNS